MLSVDEEVQSKILDLVHGLGMTLSVTGIHDAGIPDTYEVWFNTLHKPYLVNLVSSTGYGYSLAQIEHTLHDKVLSKLRSLGVTLPVIHIRDAGNGFFHVWLHSMSRPMIIDLEPMSSLTWRDHLRLAWRAWRNVS